MTAFLLAAVLAVWTLGYTGLFYFVGLKSGSAEKLAVLIPCSCPSPCCRPPSSPRPLAPRWVQDVSTVNRYTHVVDAARQLMAGQIHAGTLGRRLRGRSRPRRPHPVRRRPVRRPGRPRGLNRCRPGWEPLFQYGTTTIRDKIIWGSGAFLLGRRRAELLAELRALPIDASIVQAGTHDNAARILRSARGR